MDFAANLITRLKSLGTDRADFARQCVREFDRNEDGTVSASEFQHVFASLQRTQELNGLNGSSFVAAGGRPTLFAVTLFPSYSNQFAISAYQATAMLDAFDQDGDYALTLAELEKDAEPVSEETQDTPETNPADNTPEGEAPLSAAERADQLLALYDLTHKGYITIDDIVSAWLKDPSLGDIANAGNAIEAWDMNGDQRVSREDMIAAYTVMDAADSVIAAFDHTLDGRFALDAIDENKLAALDLTYEQLAAWDQDEDGTLTREDIIDGIKRLNLASASEAEKLAFETLLARFDTNKDSVMNETELGATLGDVTWDEDALKANFAAWDLDASGGIDASELQLGFTAIKEAQAIIAAYDKDGKGYFDAADLQRVIEENPDATNQASADEILAAWDHDGDGHVSVQDVLIMQDIMKAAQNKADEPNALSQA